MPTDDSIPPQLVPLIEEAKSLAIEIKTLLPQLVEARRNYARSRTEADARILDEIQGRASSFGARHTSVVEEMQRLSGIPEEVFEEIENEQIRGDTNPRVAREDLTVDEVATTADIDEHLAAAFEKMVRLVDSDWLRQDEGDQHRLTEITAGRPLSLVRGMRPQSELPTIHRFLQTLRVAEDYLHGHPAYDHFAGAMLLPQLTALGSKSEPLSHVGGNVEERLVALWKGPSSTSDSVAYELLVAAGCAEKGREIEFISPTTEKSPDLRCHDPFPVVIECKRKRSLSDYELAEAAAMDRLFDLLDARARDRGLWGRFMLNLSVEAQSVTATDVTDALIRQRLAAHPERPLVYPWGEVSYEELPSRLRLPGQTRPYTPHMLSFVFGWSCDLPTWDGLICRVECEGQLATNQISQPIGLLWSNRSQRAISKRSWSPLDTFGDAVSQVPPGEFGIVYVAYQEGTRAEIADERTQRFVRRVKEWWHSGSIRIPIAFLTRLYPRPLEHGKPDLIESTVRLYSKYADPLLFADFPSIVFGPYQRSNEMSTD